MTGARSTTEKGLRSLLKKKLGKTFSFDESYVDYLIGNKGSKWAIAPLSDREIALVISVLEIAGYPARSVPGDKTGRVVAVPKIIPAR